MNIEADYFLAILKKGLKGGNSDVQRFCKKHILPLYLNVASESKASRDEEIIKIYQSIGD